MLSSTSGLDAPRSNGSSSDKSLGGRRLSEHAERFGSISLRDDKGRTVIWSVVLPMALVAQMSALNMDGRVVRTSASSIPPA